MHGNGLNDPGEVPSSPNNSIIIDPGGQGLVSEEEESVFNWLVRAQLPAVLCHWLDRFQVILFGKNHNGEAHSATGPEPLLRVSRVRTVPAKCNSQVHGAGSGKFPEVSCRTLQLRGEREVASPLMFSPARKFHPVASTAGWWRFSPRTSGRVYLEMFSVTWNEFEITLVASSAIPLFCHLSSLIPGCAPHQKKVKRDSQLVLSSHFSFHLPVSGRTF